MRFAHLADVHLGFQKTAPLQELEADVFRKMMDECIAKNVDFVLMCGDLFHVNIPEMRVQKLAMEKFRDVHEAGIPTYAVYGSHDFSPVSNSAIDLLESAGCITKVTNASYADNQICLDFLVDERTGAKLTGLSGLKVGRDAEHYRALNRAPLEAEPGFKVFMFHGAISEMTGDIRDDSSMPVSYLPSGFDYYAGGHLHAFRHDTFPKHANVVYPGTPFAGYYSDMEESAAGVRRGFVLVDFDDNGVNGVDLVEMGGCGYALAEIDAEGKSAEDVNRELAAAVAMLEPAGRVAMLKIGGELGSGRVADIDLVGARKTLGLGGALETIIYRSSLTSREYNSKKFRGGVAGNRDEIERQVFEESIAQVKIKRPGLTGADGTKLAESLLAALRQPRQENEKVKDYASRMAADGLARLGLGSD